MNIQGKVWGETACIFAKCNVEIHRITGNKGMRCSKHKHEHKYNMFFVERGSLLVRVWKNDYKLVDVTTCRAGDSTTVKPGEFHRFEVLEEGTVAYEVYWIELDTNDITRVDYGGQTKRGNKVRKK